MNHQLRGEAGTYRLFATFVFIIVVVVVVAAAAVIPGVVIVAARITCVD